MWYDVFIIFTFIASYTFTAANKLDLSYKGLTNEKFFGDSNGSVTSQVEAATELNLRGNLFEAFVDCSAKLDKLEVLDLSQNNLTRFYFLCKEDDNLRKLNVSHNRLPFLNDTALTNRITKLEILDLSYNVIRHVDRKTFQHLEHLRILALNANPISSNIENGAFQNLTSLKELNLANISAIKFPADLFTPLISLTRISLALNPIEEIPALPTRLESLDISGTNIMRLMNMDFPHLTELIMNLMPRLESLDLNRLKKLQLLAVLSIESCPKFNKLTAEPTVDTLAQLKKISIRNCSIDRLGDELKSVMQNTSILDLQNNPWQCDCGMEWILSLTSTNNYHDHMRCSNPPELRGKRVFEVPAEQFQCNNFNYSALWSILGIFLSAGAVGALLYFVREPLREWRVNSKLGNAVMYKNMSHNSSEAEKILDQTDITGYP